MNKPGRGTPRNPLARRFRRHANLALLFRASPPSPGSMPPHTAPPGAPPAAQRMPVGSGAIHAATLLPPASALPTGQIIGSPLFPHRTALIPGPALNLPTPSAAQTPAHEAFQEPETTPDLDLDRRLHTIMKRHAEKQAAEALEPEDAPPAPEGTIDAPSQPEPGPETPAGERQAQEDRRLHTILKKHQEQGSLMEPPETDLPAESHTDTTQREPEKPRGTQPPRPVQRPSGESSPPQASERPSPPRRLSPSPENTPPAVQAKREPAAPLPSRPPREQPPSRAKIPGPGEGEGKGEPAPPASHQEGNRQAPPEPDMPASWGAAAQTPISGEKEVTPGSPPPSSSPSSRPAEARTAPPAEPIHREQPPLPPESGPPPAGPLPRPEPGTSPEKPFDAAGEISPPDQGSPPSLPIQAIPLEAFWPVQRKPSPTPPRLLQPLREPQERRSPGETEEILNLVQGIQPGQPTDSEIEWLPPRRSKLEPELPTPWESSEPEEDRQRTAPRVLPAPQVAELESQPEMIPTEIGPLPADLWTLIGEVPGEIPQGTSSPPVAHKPGGPALVQKKPAGRTTVFPPPAETTRSSGGEIPQPGQPEAAIRPAPETPVVLPLETHIQRQETAQAPAPPAQERQPGKPAASSQGTTVQRSETAQAPTPPAEPASPASVDKEKLAREVFDAIKKKLAIEWERHRGRY